MDLDALSKIGEFLGGTVVVISLLYLAIQAKHSAAQQRSENYGRTVDRAAALMSQWAKDPDLNRVVVDGSINLASLEPYDRIRFWWQMTEIFGVYEFAFEQRHLQVLPSHVWDRYNEHLGFWLSLPGVRSWLESAPANFSPSFMGHVRKRLEERVLSPDEAKELWGV